MKKKLLKLIACLILGAVITELLWRHRESRPRYYGVPILITNYTRGYWFTNTQQEIDVRSIPSDKLLEAWLYANSDRYEYGRELDRRRVHANWRTPKGTNADGRVEVKLRGCWYSLLYWTDTNSVPGWQE